jgi:hypothetical protein
MNGRSMTSIWSGAKSILGGAAAIAFGIAGAQIVLSIITYRRMKKEQNEIWNQSVGSQPVSKFLGDC